MYVGLISGLVNVYIFLAVRRANQKLNNSYVSLMGYLFLISAFIWFSRMLLSRVFAFNYATDPGFVNWLIITLLTLVILFRQLAYLAIRLSKESAEVLNLQVIAFDQKLALENKKTIEAEEKLDAFTTVLLAREQQLRYVLDITGDGIWDWNILTGEVQHNFRWIEMLGEDLNQQYFSVEDFKNRIHPDDMKMVMAHLEKTLAGQEEYRARYRMIRLDGREIWVQDKGAVVDRSPEGHPLRMVGAISDITEEVTSQRKIQELIFFDQLTKLPNRYYIKDRIERALSESFRNKNYCGLMYLDLDNFKNINDAYGHQVGDMLLAQFGTRIKNVIRPIDVAARIGGDEYLILFEKIGYTVDEASRILLEAIQRILSDLSKSFLLGGGVLVKVHTSIGIVVFGQKKDSFDDILNYADIAMYAAKEDHSSHYRFFDQNLKTEYDRKHELTLGLKEASKLDQFFVEYQPVVNRQEQCIGYEALARWNHPVLGVVMPDDFIPFAETSGQINQVGKAILKNILSNQSLWSDSASRSFDVMINISAHQLMNLGFTEQFLFSCELYKVPLSRIHLEVTEGAFLNNIDTAITVMHQLQEKGVTFVLDDFGTGYSSLSYLQKLPIKYLKLDKSFVAGMTNNKDDEAIVDNILDLAKSLRLKVIAEGVETKEQFDSLYAKGCDFFQGWYFGKPGKNIG